MTAEKIIQILENWAPAAHAEEWDNVGLLIGDAAAKVKKALVALDATEEVVAEAVAGGYDMLITHHPLIYNPLKKITASDPCGRKIIALIRHGIACFCAHTNLDKATDGVSDLLAKKFDLQNVTPLVAEEAPDTGIGRIGFLKEETPPTEFLKKIKSALGLSSLRYAGDLKKPFKKVGLCGGDGSSSRYIEAAIRQGCDVYVTGDLRYHCTQEATESGIALVDITHFGGEEIILDEIVKKLQPHIEVAKTATNGQVFATM